MWLEEQLVLTRRYWDRPRYHLSHLWVSGDQKVCVYGDHGEKVIAYIPSLGDEEGEGLMGQKKMGVNFDEESDNSPSAYGFKDREKFAVVSHRYFVEKKGNVCYNYVFDGVGDVLRDQNQPELAAVIVMLGRRCYLIAEEDFSCTQEEIESCYRPYRHIKSLKKGGGWGSFAVMGWRESLKKRQEKGGEIGQLCGYGNIISFKSVCSF